MYIYYIYIFRSVTDRPTDKIFKEVVLLNQSYLRKKKPDLYLK